MMGALYKPFRNFVEHLFPTRTGNYSNVDSYSGRQLPHRTSLSGVAIGILLLGVVATVACGGGSSGKQTKLGATKAGYVRIECKLDRDSCAEQPLERMDQLLEDDYYYVADRFLHIGRDLNNPIKVKSDDGNHFTISQKGSTVQATVSRGVLSNDNRSNAVAALTYVVLPSPVAWYNKGLAIVGGKPGDFVYGRDPHNVLELYYDGPSGVLKTNTHRSVQSDVLGELFFAALARDHGYNPKNGDPVASEVLKRVKSGTPTTSDDIVDLYETNLGKNLSELREAMTLLDSANGDSRHIIIGH